MRPFPPPQAKRQQSIEKIHLLANYRVLFFLLALSLQTFALLLSSPPNTWIIGGHLSMTPYRAYLPVSHGTELLLPRLLDAFDSDRFSLFLAAALDPLGCHLLSKATSGAILA